MRAMLAVLILSLPTLASEPIRAEITYPWCAQYARQGRNCGFSTYEQCRAAQSGNGGYCLENPMYQPPAYGARAAGRYRR